jgi:uncharacterized protein YbjT (DUF2867 family)
VGDLKDPKSIARACCGAKAVVSTASSTFSRQEGDTIESVDRDGQITLVDSAAQAGVDRFVFVSFRDNPAIQFPLTQAKRAVGTRLKEKGVPYTILQASWFMEVWLSPALGFDAANRKARIYGRGEAKISWVSYRDVAQLAVDAFREPRARNRVLEVGGPQALSPLEVVQVLGAAGLGDFDIEHVSEPDLKRLFEADGDALQKSFAGLMLQYASGDAIDMKPTLDILPLQLTSVRDYATRALNG